MIFILLFLIIFYSIWIFNDTKGITFFSPNVSTDNEKMLRVAYQYGKNGWLNWPGSVHSKEKKFSEHLNVLIGLIAHSLSTILIFFLSSYFLTDYVSLLISLIYLFSPWCTEVILFLGHIIYSQVWFFISLAFILLAFINQESLNIFYLCIFISGFTASICLTSSSASRS